MDLDRLHDEDTTTKTSNLIIKTHFCPLSVVFTFNRQTIDKRILKFPEH